MIAALLLAGCGGDDKDDEAAGGDQTTPSTPDAAVFQSKAVAFTFEYPKEFTADEKPQGQVLGQVSAEPDAQLNAIKIRKTANQELGTERYLDEFQRDFSETVGKVDKREEKIGDLDTGVLEFEDSIEQLGQPVEFSSVSYFFAGGGKTWQMECIADAEHRAQIGEACRAALESVQFSDEQ